MANRNTPARVRVRRFITATLNTRQPGMQPMEQFFVVQARHGGGRFLWESQGPCTVPRPLGLLNP